jgi:hypothetical protein
MPESVEMPAPVSTVMASDSAIHRLTSRMVSHRRRLETMTRSICGTPIASRSYFRAALEPERLQRLSELANRE